MVIAVFLGLVACVYNCSSSAIGIDNVYLTSLFLIWKSTLGY